MAIPNGFVLVDPPPRWLIEWCAEFFPDRRIEEVYETPDGKRMRFRWSGGERPREAAKTAPRQAPRTEAPKGKKKVDDGDLFERRRR